MSDLSLDIDKMFLKETRALALQLLIPANTESNQLSDRLMRLLRVIDNKSQENKQLQATVKAQAEMIEFRNDLLKKMFEIVGAEIPDELLAELNKGK